MMNREKEVQYNRQSITLLIWLPLLFVIILPFTFDRGIAPLLYLLSGVLSGGIWLLILMYQWKSNMFIGVALSFMLLMGFRKLEAFFFIDQVCLGYFFQWLFLMMTTMSLALYHYIILYSDYGLTIIFCPC